MQRKYYHGGKRPKSGRKPLPVKKIPLCLYIPESVIAEVGGRQAAREIAEEALKKYLIKSKM